jgi:arginine deiminase
MNSEQRQKECDILKLCYSKLGISPIWNVTGDGAYLEGGDFIPFGNKAFIGTGMRTTQVAVDQMMANDVFGTDSVIVVKDTWHYQPQMHLDTYFNIIDRDLATMTEMRANASIGDKKRSLADVYVRNKKTKKYKRIISDMDFVKYITKIEKMKIILISDADQNNYANNFLTIGPREIMSVAGQSEALQQTYKENRVKVTWIPLNNLTKGYGAAHCMTQVIQRENRMDK